MTDDLHATGSAGRHGSASGFAGTDCPGNDHRVSKLTLVDLVRGNLASLVRARGHGNNETVRRVLTTLLNSVEQAERDSSRPSEIGCP